MKSKKKKKVAKKKKGEEKELKIFLHDVANHHVFYCHDGSTFKNLEGLQQALKNMNEEIFCFHANTNKNDFSNWIYDCIGDTTLSKSLRDEFNQKKAATKVRSRITAIKKNTKGR